MEAVQTLTNALVVAMVGLVLARITHNLRREVKGEIERLGSQVSALRTELIGEIGESRAELKGEIGELRAELRGEIGELRAEMRDLRSDLTRVALAVGAEPRAGRT